MSTATSVLVCVVCLTPLSVRDIAGHHDAPATEIHRPGPLAFDRSRGDRTDPAVSVHLYNHAAVATETLNQAKEEAARAFRGIDVRMEWLEADPASSAGRFTIQMIIRRKPEGLTDDPHVLGMTLGDTHENGGTAFVFHDRVLRIAHTGEQDVAHVLGYAIVHEIGHLLLWRPAHSSTGIMRPDWNGDDLRHMANGSLTFTPTQAEQIRSKLASCCQRVGGVRDSRIFEIETNAGDPRGDLLAVQRCAATCSSFARSRSRSVDDRYRPSATTPVIVRVFLMSVSGLALSITRSAIRPACTLP